MWEPWALLFSCYCFFFGFNVILRISRIPLINDISRKLYKRFGAPSKAKRHRIHKRKQQIEEKLHDIRRQAEISAVEKKLMSEGRISNDPREPISVVIMKNHSNRSLFSN